MLSRRPAALLVVCGLLGFLVLVVPAGALAAPTSAAPPRCESSSLAAEAKGARAVFTGTVTSVMREPGATGAGEEYVQQITVERVYKPGGGSVIDTEQVDLLTERRADSCSLGPLSEGERYVVFATMVGDDLVATGSGGTTRADAALVADVEDLLGAGRPPVPPPAERAELSPVADSAPIPFVRAAVPGAALMVLGLLGLLVVRRIVRGD